MKSKLGLMIAISVCCVLFFVVSSRKSRMLEYRTIGTYDSVGLGYDNKLENAKVALLDTAISKENKNVYVHNKLNCKSYNGGLLHADKIIEILQNIYPNIKIDLYVVADNEGNVNSEKVLEALKTIYYERGSYDVINMSFFMEYRREVEDLLTKLSNEKSVIVTSAGNLGNSQKIFPACHKNVYTIGGIDETGELANYSCFGYNNFVMPTKFYSKTEELILEGTSVSAALFSAIIIYYNQFGENKMDIIKNMAQNPNNDEILGYGQPIIK